MLLTSSNHSIFSFLAVKVDAAPGFYLHLLGLDLRASGLPVYASIEHVLFKVGSFS